MRKSIRKPARLKPILVLVYYCKMNLWSCICLAALLNVKISECDTCDDNNISLEYLTSNNLMISGLKCRARKNQNQTYHFKITCLSLWCKGEQTVIDVSDSELCRKKRRLQLPEGTKNFTCYEPSFTGKDCQKTFPRFKTPPGRPSEVRNVTLFCASKDTVGVAWQPPNPPTGNIWRYNLTYGDNRIVPSTHIIRPSGHCPEYKYLTKLKTSNIYNVSIVAINKFVDEEGEPYVFPLLMHQGGLKDCRDVQTSSLPFLLTKCNNHEASRDCDTNETTTTATTPEPIWETSTTTRTTTTTIVTTTANPPTPAAKQILHSFFSTASIISISSTATIILLVLGFLSIRYLKKNRIKVNEEQPLPKDEDLRYYYPNLEDAQQESIMLHEIAEVNYPDNLTPNKTFHIQDTEDSDTSTKSDTELGNYYSDVLLRGSSFECFSNYDKLIPSFSNVISMKYVEDYLTKLCDHDLYPLKAEFERIENCVQKNNHGGGTEGNSKRSEFGPKITLPRYLKGYENDHAYIITQFPEENKIHDFWKLVWKQRIKNIVSAGTSESWPNDGNYFAEIVVINVGVQKIMDHSATEFLISYKNRTRSVIHYQLKSRIKQNIEELISSLKILSKFSEKRSTIIINCRDFGWIGTLLLSDIALKMSTNEGQVDFMSILFSLGHQEIALLNTATQYIFAHFVVYDCWCDQKFSIALDEKFEAEVENVLTKKSVRPLMADVKTNFNLYQKFFGFQENRNSHLPYPNSVEIDYFACSRKFICTPQPNANDTNFWKFITESQVNTIVALNELDRTKYSDFLVWDDKIMNSVKLKIMEERHFDSYVVTKLYAKYKYSLKEITVLSMKNWRQARYTPANVLDLVRIYQEMYENPRTSKEEGTVLLTCSNGHTACGLFCAMSILLEMVKVEKKCDVFTAVKLVRRYNSQFVQEWGQFDFLYKAALEYFTNFVKS